jgi:hypothetical protein
MGTPYHISQSISQRYGDKASAEFQALSLIAGSLPHPDRTLLSAFVPEATEKELASQFFLIEVLGREEVAISEFLAGWIRLLRMGTFPVKVLAYADRSLLVRPTICDDIDPLSERDIRRRDGDRCSVSMGRDKRKLNGSLLLVYIVSPTLFSDRDMTRDVGVLLLISSI